MGQNVQDYSTTDEVQEVCVRNAPLFRTFLPDITVLVCVILYIVQYTPEQNTPFGEIGLVSMVFIISLNTMSLFFFFPDVETAVNRAVLYCCLKMKK